MLPGWLSTNIIIAVGVIILIINHVIKLSSFNISNVAMIYFLAATKQLYEFFSLSACPPVRLSHLFHYVPIIVSS